MNDGQALPRRYQFSLRSLLAATAAVAFSLAPVAWIAHRHERLRLAREQAIRSVALEAKFRSDHERWKVVAGSPGKHGETAKPARTSAPASVDATARMEQLQRENAELKNTVERLRREVQRLEASAR